MMVEELSSLNAFEEAQKQNKPTRCYAVMYFDTERTMGISDIPNRWFNTVNHYFTNGTEALNEFANTPCTWSHLVDADDEFELKCLMGEYITNMSNENWVNENVYPYM